MGEYVRVHLLWWRVSVIAQWPKCSFSSSHTPSCHRDPDLLLPERLPYCVAIQPGWMRGGFWGKADTDSLGQKAAQTLMFRHNKSSFHEIWQDWFSFIHINTQHLLNILIKMRIKFVSQSFRPSKLISRTFHSWKTNVSFLSRGQKRYWMIRSYIEHILSIHCSAISSPFFGFYQCFHNESILTWLWFILRVHPKSLEYIYVFICQCVQRQVCFRVSLLMTPQSGRFVHGLQNGGRERPPVRVR